MRSAKKFLSIILAAVLLLSTVSVSAFALTAENSDYANIKYSIKQTDTLVQAGTEIDLSSTAYAGKVYALTISVKAARGISYLQVPYYYNMDKFGQITLYDSGEIYYAYNGYTSDMGENAVYDIYSMGAAWSDAGQYKADGSTATNALQTKTFGLANSSVAGAYSIVTKIVDPTTTGYDLWCEGISEEFTVGCGFITVNNLFTKAKSSFINVVNGKVVTDDYVDVMTVYLYNYDGDAEGEVVGAYADWDKDTVNNIQVTWCTTDASGLPMAGFIAGTSQFAGSWASFVENSVIEADAEPTIVNPLKGQIRFDKKDGAYAGTFDVRALATITEKDFNATFTDAATAEDMIEEIGFVFAAGSNVGTPDMAGVKALVENGTALSGYEKKTVDYISTGATNVAAGNYVFSCIVTDVPDADKADSLVAVGYIKWTDAEGTHYNYYPAAQEISFNALYTAHYNSAFPQA